VAFGALKGDAAAQTFTHADDAGNISFTVQFDTSKIGGANDFAIDTGHEGTHLDDIRNPLFANPQTTLDPFQQEFRGYQTSGWVARGLGLGNLGDKGIEIWNSSWSNVDRLMDQGITRFITTRRDPPIPEKTPHNPWEN
jgi:hypothetical protein